MLVNFVSGWRGLVLLAGLRTKVHADAVIGLQLDVETLGASNGMLMVVATGTAVRIDCIADPSNSAP